MKKLCSKRDFCKEFSIRCLIPWYFFPSFSPWFHRQGGFLGLWPSHPWHWWKQTQRPKITAGFRHNPVILKYPECLKCSTSGEAFILREKSVPVIACYCIYGVWPHKMVGSQETPVQPPAQSRGSSGVRPGCPGLASPSFPWQETSFSCDFDLWLFNKLE